MAITQRFATEKYVEDLLNNLDLRHANVEQGSWTPVIAEGADSVSKAVGSYLKVDNICIINFTIEGIAPTTATRLKITGIPYPVNVLETDEERSGGGWLDGYDSSAGDKTENHFTGWTLKKSGSIYGLSSYVDGTSTYVNVISKDVTKPTTFRGSGMLMYSTISGVENKVKSVSHRGYNLEAPENTLPAFILSAEKGFTYVECDVAFTKDGVAVLLHDDTIDRTSNGTGVIEELYYKDLVELDFGSWFDAKYAGTKIPTLSEFLRCCQEYNLHPYIEIKNGPYTEGQIRQIVDLVYDYGMIRNSTFISFNSEFLTWVKDYCDVARVGFIKKTITQSDIDTTLSLKTDNNYVFIDTKYTNLTDEIVTLCQNSALPIEIWNVNDAEYIKTMNPYISGVTSDSLFVADILNNKNDDSGELLYYLPNSAFCGLSIKKTPPYYKDTDGYATQGKRLTKVTELLTVNPGDTIRLDIVGFCPLQGAIWAINETGAAAIANNQELTDEMYIDTLWQESGYTLTIPEGAVYIWVNVHKTDDSYIKLNDLDYVRIVKV